MKLPRASTVIASVFGIGYFEFAPGTVMSAIAVPLAILIALRGGGAMGILGATLIALIIGSANGTATALATVPGATRT